MDSLNKNLITTKDASELSGYTADYLARLVRSGEIVGERTGHTWLIDRASLDLFLEKQKIRKAERAQELADARAKEYRTHRQAKKPDLKPVSVRHSYRAPRAFGQVPFRSHAFALSLAVMVVVLGAVGARSTAIPQVAGEVATTAQEVATGFSSTFIDVPHILVSRVDAIRIAIQERGSHVSLTLAGGTYVASPLFAKLDFSSPQERLEKNYRAPVFASAGTTMSALGSAPMTTEEAQSAILDSYAFLTTPSDVGGVLMHAYVSVGSTAYVAIAAAFSSYRSLIEQAGEKSLTLAGATRESLPLLSHFITQMNLALGNAVIDVTHAAINTDVAIVYGLADAAPASARTVFTSISTTGEVLADAASRAPSLVATAYLYMTAAPATLAPAIAQTVFNAEYAASTHFVGYARSISEQYLAFVEGTGSAIYTSIADMPSLMHGRVPSLANVLGGSSSAATFTLSAW